ncbi:MAG: glycosyltransferase family 4 protein [Alphaproteobacteria bacterium]|nr:glycosyltransferase family 4 protein [Alphaproteobacteria bacterium]
MKLLLVSTKPGIAGVETLIQRMISYLMLREDIEINLLFMIKGQNDVLANSFESKCTVYYGIDLLNPRSEFKKKEFDYIYSFSLFPLVFSLLISGLFFKRAKVSCGVYHPLEYCWKHGPNSCIRKIAHKLLKSLPLENIFFMSQLTQEKHTLYLERDFSKSPIIPVAIDVQRFQNVIRNPNRRKIISIGNIVNFRTYMFQIVDTCCDLNKNHPDLKIEYHIYGDGPLRKKLVDYINSKSASEFVFLHGLLPYDNLEDVFKDAFLLVGCGTAMLEASAAGVPSLITLCPSTNPYTYGFFPEINNGYNLGGPIPNAKTYTFYEKIMELYRYTPGEYKHIENLSQQKAALFSPERIMDDFINKLKNSKIVDLKLSYIDYFLIVFSYMFWKAIGMLRFETILSSRYCEDNKAF